MYAVYRHPDLSRANSTSINANRTYEARMNDAAALTLSLQLLGMKPDNLLHLINSAQDQGGELVVRSTYTRWANGSTALPVPMKALLRDRLLNLLKEPAVELPRRITVAFVGKGGTGRTSNSMLLTALARSMGIQAIYVDATSQGQQQDSYSFSVARNALPSRSVVMVPKGTLMAAVSRACPENGIAFIDCPPRVFLGLSGDQELESELLPIVDYFVITSEAAGMDMQIAEMIATQLKKHNASFRVLMCGQKPNVKRIAKYHSALAAQEIPTFSNYIFGTGNTFEDRLLRYGHMHNSSGLEDEDVALVDTLIELLEEFTVSVDVPHWQSLEASSFLDVVKAVAEAKGVSSRQPLL